MELCAIDNYVENNETLLIKGKIYLIYSEFEMEDLRLGYVVLCEDDNFRGLDSSLFETDITRKTRNFNLI